jgi:glycosyltransferase involved in cell wall biosynthesis
LRLRAELLGEEGRRLVVTIARLSPQKGIETLIEVARMVRQQTPGAVFAIVGDGPQEAALRKLAIETGDDSGLRFVGRSQEPHLYLNAADLFLLTSRWEALPFTIVEAFQAGLPAVATDCGGVRELITAETGRVTPIGDAGAIAGAVLEILRDDGLRALMSEAARKRALLDRFKPEVMHARIEALYREVVSAG